MRQLLNEITCLHCWTKFNPEDVLWRSEHRDLLGDPLLGEEAQLRFLPSRFDLQGNAIDAKGQKCRDLACPHCHLSVPRALLERVPIFISLIGTPSCGKSFFLGALATQLRRELPSSFKLDFSDADSVCNQILHRYEEHLFLHERPEDYVALADLIPKTQLHGDLYDTVKYGEQRVTYPRPLSFLLEPLDAHPNFGNGQSVQRLLCMYDNAGEHFLPGQDSISAPGTRHMAESSFLLFLFDPTQDPRWHAAMAKANPDLKMPRTRHAGRQEGVLREAADRIRKIRGIADGVRHDRPLIVILSKSDVWKQLLPANAGPMLVPWNQVQFLNFARITDYSQRVRGLLEQYLPEVVFTAESFCDQVYYLPVSAALGTSPRFDPQGQAFIRPADIAPEGVTLPFLLGLSLITKGMIGKGTA